MSNVSYIDVSGIYSTQKILLDSLRDNVNADPSKVNNIQDQLESVNYTLNVSNATTGNLFTRQTQMQQIVDSEKNRLLLKKDKIDGALEGQKRLIDLNESYRQKYSDYIIIISIITFALFIIIILSLIAQMVTFIPSILFSILYAVILFFAFYLCYNKYLDIAARDKLYYGELNLEGPTIISAQQIAAAKGNVQASSGSDLLGTINIGGCVGPQCCSTTTVWDSTNSVCVTKPTVSGFTTLGNAYVNGDFLVKSGISGNVSGNTFLVKPITSGNVSANSPNEFNKYSLI